jgi:hypothetical protein
MSKYKNGYWPKIEYWTTQIRDEVFNTKKPCSDEVMYFHKKLQYFIGKQWDLDNPIKQETFQVVE